MSQVGVGALFDSINKGGALTVSQDEKAGSRRSKRHTAFVREKLKDTNFAAHASGLLINMAMKTRHNRLHDLLHQDTLDPQVADVIMRQKMSRENGEHPMDILQTGWGWRSAFLNWFFMLRNEPPILALLPRNIQWKNISTRFTRKYLNVPHTVPRCFREYNFDEKNPKATFGMDSNHPFTRAARLSVIYLVFGFSWAMTGSVMAQLYVFSSFELERILL